MTSALRIIVTGLVGHHPLGGMTWHYLQYVVGLIRLGHDVYYFEDTGKWPYDPMRGEEVDDCRFSVTYVARVMSRFGLEGRWAYRCATPPRWFGLPDAERESVLQSADLLINVSGSLGHPEDYREIPRLAYVDTDPVFTQVQILRGKPGFREQVDAHDVHFSFGERISDSGPATGHRWRPTRQPIVLDEWHPSAPRRNAFTTVMNWKTKSRPPVHDGRAYGQKDIEFGRFLELPERVAPIVLEIAANSGRGHHAPMELLTSRGWHVVDPEVLCLDFDSYRSYVESSMAEWSVAKHGYVEGRSGWFSERSACYLAAGRPVVVQDTGFSTVLPIGEGIISFSTVDEAVSAVREVDGHYGRHAAAARAIAEGYFDSSKVLNRLTDEALHANA
jgi:hypothetical protein